KADKVPDRNRHADEMQRRYQAVLEKFPEFALINLARFGVAVAHHRKGELDRALERLEAIPVADRTGDLAAVSYLMADCLVRRVLAKTGDAVLAAGTAEQFKKAVELLETFL